MILGFVVESCLTGVIKNLKNAFSSDSKSSPGSSVINAIICGGVLWFVVSYTIRVWSQYGVRISLNEVWLTLKSTFNMAISYF